MNEHHVAAERLPQRAFCEESRGKVVEVGDLCILLIGEYIDGQVTLVLIESKVTGVVVGEVVSAVAIADDEELDEAEEGFGVAVARIVFVLDDLLHGPTRMDAERLQLDLHAGHAIDENEHIETVVAVVCRC